MATNGCIRSAGGQNGMVLMPLVLVIVLAGALIGAGMHLVGPMTLRMQTTAARDLLSTASRSIIAWSVSMGRLPTAAEFGIAAGVHKDPWNKPLIYVYDGDLADTDNADAS